MRVILASASPARLGLLSRAGVRCDVVVSGVDEDAVAAGLGGQSPAGLVAGLALAKGRAVAERLSVGEETTAASAAMLVIAADTVLVVAGQVRGKPRDAAQATAWWREQRGGVGRVHSGHWVGLVHGGRVQSAGPAASSTLVRFADVTDAEIAAYVASGEPLAAAGGFTIQGVGGAFIAEIEGDPHTVAGLSLPLVRTLAAELGIAWPDLWGRS